MQRANAASESRACDLLICDVFELKKNSIYIKKKLKTNKENVQSCACGLLICDFFELKKKIAHAARELSDREPCEQTTGRATRASADWFLLYGF